MNKINQLFTYGFEIEGAFSDSLPDKLRAIADIEVEEHEDGSVQIRDREIPDTMSCLESQGDSYEDDNGDWIDGDYKRIDELCVGVFHDYKDMVRALRVFKHNENYVQNTTCGLHVHIGALEGHKHIQSLIFGYKFIASMQKWTAQNLCSCVQDRLSGNTYIRPYTSLDSAFYEIGRHEKYRFVGNHHQGTAEFRFFSPCRHMVDNVEKFFEEFFARLAEEKLKIKRKITIHKPKIGASMATELALNYRVGISEPEIYRITDAMIENDYQFTRFRRYNHPQDIFQEHDIRQEGSRTIEINNDLRHMRTNLRRGDE
jgi:hypothetical protein